VGKYFIEVWKAAGMKMSNVKFIWASEEINKRSNEYWMQVMDIACKNTIARIQKCATIMGKKESDQLKVSQLFYPCMQCTDVFFLDVDICQLGLDQRKVNMLAREYADNLEDKPIIVSHGMISGLVEGQEKMSKSNPDSAIFMEDTPKDVESKIKKAFCK
jgi:tyrosyl-tRNA synthetase